MDDLQAFDHATFWVCASAAHDHAPVSTILRHPSSFSCRLVEQSDFEAAQDLFGGEDGMRLETFLPKTVKDFEDFAAAITNRLVVVHRDNKNFKAFAKALVKHVCAPLTSTETKDIETCVAGIRNDKNKAELAEANAKKGVKKQLNVGKAGATAGLDDYVYDNLGVDDDYDFM